jgi:acid phosphatase (class A)
MKNIKNLVILYLLLIALLSINNAVAKAVFDKPYFDAENIKPNVIDSPALLDSKELQEEIKQIIKLQQNIELKDIDLALDEKEMRVELITEYVNSNLTQNKLPKLYNLLTKVGATSYFATNKIKNHYKLTRPYLANKSVQAIISPSKGYSYPSGHTTGSYLWAFVLSQLIPKQADDFKNRAQQIAWHRVQMGMHYPQDIKGGKQLALILFNNLMNNPNFLQDFNDALAELKQNNLIK